MTKNEIKYCQICGCKLNKSGEYAKPTMKGRSHATRHHYVAKRFFGQIEPIFGKEDFPEIEKKVGIFCYECHEELLHNPIFYPEDVVKFSELIRKYKYDEQELEKKEGRDKIGNRIKLLHKVISTGINELLKKQ